MKVTRRQLRRIICEYYEHMLAKGHVDGAQWSGTLENLAMVQSKTWGHGAVVDPKGWHEDIKLAGRWTQGTVNERRLRRIIREVGARLQGKGWQLSDGSCNTHNISADDAAEAMAVLGEFGYELGLPPAVDSNNMAINDALAAYPGEFSYEDFLCAIRVTQGRGA